MDKTAIAKELSSNRLDLTIQDTMGIPVDMIRVGCYSIGGPENEDLDATVWAFTKKMRDRDTVFCCSFMVRISDTFIYYYRDHLFEVNDLIAALRAHHGYKPID